MGEGHWEAEVSEIWVPVDETVDCLLEVEVPLVEIGLEREGSEERPIYVVEGDFRAFVWRGTPDVEFCQEGGDFTEGEEVRVRKAHAVHDEAFDPRV